MTPAWSNAAQWRALSIGVDNSAHFLQLWQAWQADKHRPRMLHFAAVCGHEFKNSAVCANSDSKIKPLAEQLDLQLWGLLPGLHRLVFESGQVLLTVCVGDMQTLLRQQRFKADSVFLDYPLGASAVVLNTVKAIARLSRRGTVLQTALNDLTLQAALQRCGFQTIADDGLQSVYHPTWHLKTLPPVAQPGRCVVIGSGLAGAAAASSLARRGWAVTVLDAASQPASGASGLPAGLLVPHTSPDDSLLSRLSRSGVRMTLQQARARLRHGMDWGHTGVLQRSLEGNVQNLPPAWTQNHSQAASNWCHAASPRTLAAASLPLDSTALWHVQAGWVHPAALVNAWLASPGINWRGRARVTHVEQTGSGWSVMDAAGNVLAEADLMVLCAGHASRLLAKAAGAVIPDLQAIRGQITYGVQLDTHTLPPFPVNGHGGFIPGIPTPDGPLWLMGASYERDVSQPALKLQDQAQNFARLQTLLPLAAEALADQFNSPKDQGWAGIRCATTNRLPLVTPLDGVNHAWLCTGMGSRGLSFAALCGELLAAGLHNEPLPIEQKLADAMRCPARKLL